MEDVKIGFSQIKNPAPAWVTNLLRGAVFFFGGMGMFVASLDPSLMSNAHKIAGGAAASFFLICLQALELCLGISPQQNNQQNGTDVN